MKEFELRSLRAKDGWYHAVMYSRTGHYHKDQSFLYYSKKEVISLLRNKYDCVVTKEFC